MIFYNLTRKIKMLNLKLDYFELGYLYASIKKDAWDGMPRKLWLRLHILATQSYVGHKIFGKQAKRDIKIWSKELRELNRK